MRICIALVLKDAERYLQSYLFQRLDELEAYYRGKHTFSYVIYESNSSDNTAEFLKMFAQLPEREGRVHLYTAENTETNTKDKEKEKEKEAIVDDASPNIARIRRICDARNAMLDMFREKLRESDWTLFIDGDIYFEVEYLKQMLHNASHAAIITCNSIDLDVNTGENAESVPYISSNHYYDTYACVDIDYNLHYPVCISPHCISKLCAGACVPKWDYTRNVVEVQSAWGGFVLVNSKAFAHENVKWETCSLDAVPLLDGVELNYVFTDSEEKEKEKEKEDKENNAICEHILFCNKVKNALEKPIVILTDLSPYWISGRTVSTAPQKTS